MISEPMADPIRVTVFDYGAGNLHSLVKALETPMSIVRVERDPTLTVHDTDALVLPGVGAFAPAAAELAAGRGAMREAILDGLPCLGICLGMQLLFEASDEGPGDGLGVFAGRVTRLQARRIPHIGWNAISDVSEELARSSQLVVAYYANSFVCRPAHDSLSHVGAWSDHESDRFPAIIRRDLIVGTQFHPEKSSVPGVRFVHAFLRAVAQRRDETRPILETR